MPSGSEIEQAAYEWWSKSLQRFFDEHPDETYAALAAVCNPFDPSFFLCLACTGDDLDDPEGWTHTSIDYDRKTAAQFSAHFDWLDGFCGELCGADQPKMRELFETFVEALMRAMVRTERELVDGSARFGQPADVFVLFQDDEIKRARDRYRALKQDGRLDPGWSKVIAGMKG